MSPRPGRRPLRRAPHSDERLNLLVFTEGEKTEDGYLVNWRRSYRDRVLVTVDAFHGTPLQLVEHAVDAKKFESREQRRGRGRAHDEIWCVFDRDEHPYVEEALALAKDHGIGVVVSNPCIELWFVLHFAEHTAYIGRHEAQKLSRQYLNCDKVLSLTALSALTDNYLDARGRAQKLDAKHEGDGSEAHANPSSNMWQLIDRIRGG